MKKLIVVILCLLFSHNISLGEASSKVNGPIKIEIKSKVVDTDTKYTLLLEKLRVHESRGKSRIVNNQGCMGLYQFKESTLRFLGYEVSLDEFRTNPNHFPEWQQHEAALKFTKMNRKLLSKVITEFEGKVVNGIEVTETGILAAAALAGPGGVKKYFNSSHNAKDCYGTSIEDMLVRFANV